MAIIISGADERFQRLCDMLKETGADAKYAQNARDFENGDIYIGKHPFDELSLEGIQRLSKGAKLILLTAGNTAALSKEYKVYKFSEDELFLNENAILTAEGAVFCAMQKAPFALYKEKAAVIGYGRIGRALTEMLTGLKMDVTVFSRRESGRLQAMARGAKGASIESLCPLLSDFRLIFVTSPDRMLSKKELSYVSGDAYIFDLSSAPYGTDRAAAESMHLHAYWEGALPGRYCPQSAAQTMYRAVKRIMGGFGL